MTEFSERVRRAVASARWEADFAREQLPANSEVICSRVETADVIEELARMAGIDLDQGGQDDAHAAE